MIRACALIAVLISGALIDLARGGDLVECEPQQVTGDGRHWAYRIVDGRECWYPGRPGKPKNELFWDRGITPSARQSVEQPQPETEPAQPPSQLAAAPPGQPQTSEPMPEEWRATPADQLLAFSCCWPELEEPSLPPQSTSEGAQPSVSPEEGRPPAWPLALLPFGLYALWWIGRLAKQLVVAPLILLFDVLASQLPLDYAPFSTSNANETPTAYSCHPARSIFSNAPNFRCSAIAALVRSP
jgi:hypothetical protein